MARDRVDYLELPERAEQVPRLDVEARIHIWKLRTATFNHAPSIPGPNGGSSTGQLLKLTRPTQPRDRVLLPDHRAAEQARRKNAKDQRAPHWEQHVSRGREVLSLAC